MAELLLTGILPHRMKQLTIVAKNNGLSKNAYIRQAINDALDKERPAMHRMEEDVIYNFKTNKQNG